MVEDTFNSGDEMRFITMGLILGIITGFQFVESTRTGWQYSSSKSAKLWRGFSLSSEAIQKKSIQLKVVNLQSDGQDYYTFHFPSLHPFLTVAASISTNFYTESLEYSQTVNEFLTVKADLSSVFRPNLRKVPLSIPKKYTP